MDDPPEIDPLETTAPTDCEGCLIAQRVVAVESTAYACSVCGTRWEPADAPAPPPCSGCVEARAHLAGTRDEHGHRAAKAWLRCDVCGEIVALDERGIQSALDVTEHRGRAADARMRRRAMLLELDNLARWRSFMEGHGTEPSPIVGDGNRGGGAKSGATDRPDYVNERNLELRAAQATAAKLGVLESRARVFEQDRHAARDRIRAKQKADEKPAEGPRPVAFERAVAVLRWLSERCGASTRKDLARRLGLDFGGRAAADARVEAEAELMRRRAIVPITSTQIVAERSRIHAEAREELAAIREERGPLDAERWRLMQERRPIPASLEFAFSACEQATLAACAKRVAALNALHARIEDAKQALGPREWVLARRDLPRVPTVEEVTELGLELLRLADALWWRGDESDSFEADPVPQPSPIPDRPAVAPRVG